MSASRYPGLDHPTSSLRGPPSPSPPPQQANGNTSNESKLNQVDKDGNGKSPGGGGVKRRAEGEGVRENNANTPSTSRLSSQDPRQQQQNGGSRSPSSSHPSVVHYGGANNVVEDPAKRRRLVSGSKGPPSSSNKDQHHSSDPTVDFDKPPISPVVLGFNLANTDPGVRDTVRSALRMKEQQQLIIQQRRGGEGFSSAASTPPQASTKTGGDAVAGEGGAVSSSSAAAENGMDVDVKPAAAPAVEIQVASPALGSGGFSSGGLASRTHEEGRAKAGGLSILTPASADAAQSSTRTGGPAPKPLSARPLVPSQNASQPGASFPPPQQQQYTPQAGQTPRSASSSSQHQQQQQPSGGPPSSRPSIAPRVPSNGYPSNGGMTPNGMNHHAMPSPAPYGGGQQQQQQQPPYNPPSSARGAPSASYFGGGPGQHRPHSPSSPPATQKTTFLAPFERFYDALVDSRTLQQTLSDLSMRSADIHRRGDEEIRRFQHNHQQAANLLNTLQVSSTSLQEMVRKEVAVVREETRREVEVIWKRIRQLEGGFVAAGLPIPPPLPSTTPSVPPPSASAPAVPGPLAPPAGEFSRRRSSVVARLGEEGGGKGSASGSGSNRDEEEEDQILDEDSQDEESNSATAKARKGTRGGKAGRGASRPPKGVRGARIGG